MNPTQEISKFDAVKAKAVKNFIDSLPIVINNHTQEELEFLHKKLIISTNGLCTSQKK